MGKSLYVVPPEGYEIDEEKSTFKEIVFKKKEKQFPKSFEELKEVKGWYICGSTGRITEQKETGMSGWEDLTRDIWPTKELAEAALAMSQLMQLRKVWIGEWEPDYQFNSYKYGITNFRYSLTISTLLQANSPLSFPTKEMAEQFLETHKTLLEQAKPLL